MPRIKGSKNSNNDTTQEASSGYLREFNLQYKNYVEIKSDENLAVVHRTIALLSTISPSQFQPEQLETAHFFVNLHALIKTLVDNDDSDVLWTCVSLLQNCSRNPCARSVMMKDYRFVPLLTTLLARTQMLTEKATRLLTLMQDLTYGIQITWEEPYVGVLLQLLRQTINMAADEGDEKQAILALSVLVNVCYKNLPVILLFMRTVECMSDFGRKIQRFGPLASKLTIILSEDLHTPERSELHIFLRSTFASMQNCLKKWDVGHLNHMVDFLLDSQSHSGLHNAMLSYVNYCEDIERLLGPLENNANMSDPKEELFGQRQMCIAVIFKLILYVLQLSAVKDENGQENVISLDAITPRIFDLVCQWLESNVCGTAAVRLLDGLIQWAKAETIVPRIARDPSIVVQIITIIDNVETPAEQTNAILQLLLSLLQQTKTEKLILSKISESFFDKMFAPLLNAAPQTLSTQEIDKTIYCLLLLINFARIAKKAYFEKCCATLQMPQIQNAIALANLNGNEDVCEAVFKIAQFEHFPLSAVAKQIAKLNASPAVHVKFKKAKPLNDIGNSPDLSEILKTERQFFSTKTEERLLALIENISMAQRNNQLNNISTTQIIELYNYEKDRYKSMKTNMQRSLDLASNEKTELLQHINLQDAELQKLRNFNFELNIKIEGLETQSQDLATQRENFKRNYTDLLKKTADKTEKLQITEKRLSVKVSELIALQKEFSDLKAEHKLKTEHLQNLEMMSKENVSKIDKLKKSITAFESEIRSKISTLEEKEREIAKLNKELESEKEAKKKADGFIAVLEQQIQEKNEELRNYENELSETEELRKTIMSLMESKKPKRKT